ncbi:MAG: glycosyltransferase family 4 protein [Candidatus Erginobacter occultus]|nr:glycosyltransferase family 4 protein [Candidatus Erginobacter occultus]
MSKSDRPGSLKGRYGRRLEISSSGNVPAGIRTPVFAARLLLSALRERPALVISAHPHFAPAAAWLKRTLSIPAAVSAYGVEVWDLPRGRVRRALGRVDMILPISNYTRGRMEAGIGIPEERFRVIPVTFDGERFSPSPAPAGLRQRYGIDPGDRVLITVCRLVVSRLDKGYSRVIEILPRLLPDFPGLRFLIVGEGSDRPNVERRVRELGLEGRVILAGYVPDEELPDHYRMADGFAMPSLREGFGIVFLEAMGCGKRCLGGNRDAAADALRGGELGILVDPESPEDLEMGLRQLLSEPPPDPLELHARVSRCFGREVFREKVAGLLAEFGLV